MPRCPAAASRYNGDLRARGCAGSLVRNLRQSEFERTVDQRFFGCDNTYDEELPLYALFTNSESRLDIEETDGLSPWLVYVLSSKEESACGDAAPSLILYCFFFGLNLWSAAVRSFQCSVNFQKRCLWTVVSYSLPTWRLTLIGAGFRHEGTGSATLGRLDRFVNCQVPRHH